jgi:hypothetical protein
MRIDRRFVALISGAWMAATVPLRAMADTGPRPIGVEPDPAGSFDPTDLIKVGAIVAVALVVVRLGILRPTWRRRMAAVAIVIVTGFVALVMVFGALFSDFSGEHRTYPLLLIAGVAVLAVGLVAAACVAMSGTRTAS